MNIIPGDRVVFFDVDDTLITEDQNNKNATSVVKFSCYGMQNYVWKHENGIRLLKIFKSRGYTTLVWSQSGVEWATSVVRALGLEDVVDAVLTKPQYYVDDMPCTEWMGSWRKPDVVKRCDDVAVER